jgi:hypothetical protein
MRADLPRHLRALIAVSPRTRAIIPQYFVPIAIPASKG